MIMYSEIRMIVKEKRIGLSASCFDRFVPLPTIEILMQANTINVYAGVAFGSIICKCFMS